MIVNMEKGNPIGMKTGISEFFFMLPTSGECKGFAAFLAQTFWSKLKRSSAQNRPLGSILKKNWEAKRFCGIACYWEQDGTLCYDKAPGVISIALLRPVLEVPNHIAFILSAQDVPAQDRFLIMQQLARSNLPVEFFDFSYS